MEEQAQAISAFSIFTYQLILSLDGPEKEDHSVLG